MHVLLLILLLLPVSCGRLSNQIHAERLEGMDAEAQPAQMEEMSPIVAGASAESSDAGPLEDTQVEVTIPEGKPEESTEERDCRRFLAAQNSAAPMDRSRSKLGRFYTTLAWSDLLIAGELTNQALVKFYDASQEPIPLKLMSFKLFMPSMNHGTIKLDKLLMIQDATSLNQWLVSQIYFSMGGKKGEWVVDIEAGICGESDSIRVIIDQEVIEPE